MDVEITDLPSADNIDRAADLLFVYDDSANRLEKITPNTVLGITGSPVGTSDSQTLTNKTLTTPTIDVVDTALTIQDNVDSTKKIQFNATDVTAGQTRVYRFPDASDILVTESATQGLANKTLQSPVINTATIVNPTLTVNSISEHTAANGVTVDGLNIKDGKLNTNNSVVTSNLTDDSVTPDKMDFGIGTAFEAATGTTTSSSYTTTLSGSPGTNPSVTVTVPASGTVIVLFGAATNMNTTAQTPSLSFAVSGANTIAASDDNRIAFQAASGGASYAQAANFVTLTGLTAGSTTFTLNYKVSSGTGTFLARRLTVIPIGD